MASTLPALTTLAWRNLWRNHRRTTIMLLAIGVGAWAMIFINALILGMIDGLVRDGVQNLPGHIQAHHPAYRDDPSIQNSIAQPDADMLAALADPSIVGMASRLRVPAMISSERDSRGVTLLGVDPTEEISIGFDPESIVEGRFLEGPDDRGLVIGRKLLEHLETRLGKRVVVMSQDPDNQVADRGFRIVGVYRAAASSIEETNVYAGRDTIQTLLGTEGLVSEVAFLGQDFENLEPVRELIAAASPADWSIMTWGELDEMLLLAHSVMGSIMFVWIVIVFIVLAFGIVNTLMMAIFERVREIGLMLALGMRPGSILKQVMLESLFLVALGLLIGNLLAIGSLALVRDGIDLTAYAGAAWDQFGASAILYPSFTPADLIMTNVVVILLGFATSLVPAWHASRYHPVEALAKT